MLKNELRSISKLNASIPKGWGSSHASPRWWREKKYDEKDARLVQILENEDNRQFVYYTYEEEKNIFILYFNVKGEQFSFHIMWDPYRFELKFKKKGKWVGTRRNTGARVFEFQWEEDIEAYDKFMDECW